MNHLRFDRAAQFASFVIRPIGAKTTRLVLKLNDFRSALQLVGKMTSPQARRRQLFIPSSNEISYRTINCLHLQTAAASRVLILMEIDLRDAGV